MSFKNSITRIEFNVLDDDMFEPRFNYFNTLYEEHHIVTDYDNVFDALVDMAWEYKNCRYISFLEFDEDSTYKKKIFTNFIYNPIKRMCVDIDDNFDMINADGCINWHPLNIQIIKYNPSQKDYDFNTSAYIFRDVKNKMNITPSEDIRTSIYCDPITIVVYIDNIDDKFTLRRVIRHELLHSKQIYSTNKDILNTRKNQLCRVSIHDDFVFDDDAKEEYKNLFGYVYIFAKNEREAFRNEIYQLVLDMDREELKKYIELYHSYNDIAINIINDYYNLFMVHYYDEMKILYKTNNYRYLLLIGYYLHRHNYFKRNSKYIDKDYLQKLIDEKRQPSNEDFDDNLKRYIDALLSYIIETKNSYMSDLMESVFDAIDKRGFVVNS